MRLYRAGGTRQCVRVTVKGPHAVSMCAYYGDRTLSLAVIHGRARVRHMVGGDEACVCTVWRDRVWRALPQAPYFVTV